MRLNLTIYLKTLEHYHLIYSGESKIFDPDFHVNNDL
jgi:hypothetical protein